MRILLASFSILAACATARAQTPDNVAWQTPLGRVESVFVSGSTAVFEYELPYGDNIGRFYFNGLAGEFGGPGPVEGYWSEPDISHDDEAGDALLCPFAIIDDNDRKTHNWGRVKIVFTGDDFPGDFVILRGRCFQEPMDAIPGKLIG